MNILFEFRKDHIQKWEYENGEDFFEYNNNLIPLEVFVRNIKDVNLSRFLKIFNRICRNFNFCSIKDESFNFSTKEEILKYLDGCLYVYPKKMDYPNYTDFRSFDNKENALFPFKGSSIADNCDDEFKDFILDIVNNNHFYNIKCMGVFSCCDDVKIVSLS